MSAMRQIDPAPEAFLKALPSLRPPDGPSGRKRQVILIDTSGLSASTFRVLSTRYIFRRFPLYGRHGFYLDGGENV